MTTNSKYQATSKTSDTSKSVHLSASAGSGKTRALKDRYLSLLDELDHRGLNIDQAVAITFTDKAAAEIKERVMQDLPEAMLKKIIRGRQDLRISTIHSFCMNLLKRYPLEARLPPDFGVLDARDQTHKIQNAIEEALEESGRDPSTRDPLGQFTADELVTALVFLISIRSKLKRMEIDAGGPAGLIRSVRAGMSIDQAESELQEFIESAEWRKVLQHMEQVLQSQPDFYNECLGEKHLLLAKAETIEDAERISKSLVAIYFKKDGTPSKKAYIAKINYLGNKREEYENAFFSVQEILARLRTLSTRRQAGYESLSLLRLYQHAESNYQESKLREGLLDFDDLEIYAYRLLQGQDSPDILYWLDRKILHILVDEFQDTSDIQWAIVNKLTEEIFAGQGADKPMRPTLFVVGDEKQSIYRFREANYRLLEDVRNKMERNIPAEWREILTLDKNFRSTPEIIEIVNEVFSTLWGESYKPSEVERKNQRGSVRLIELSPKGTGETTDVLSEAEILAREIKAVIEAKTAIFVQTAGSLLHGRTVIEDSSLYARPAGYGDCAVLIQSRTKLKEYEAALESAGIPFRVVGGIGFYDEDEIQALINVLFFLWNRADMLALAAALKSPLFGFTEKDLFDLFQEKGTVADALKKHRPSTAELLQNWMNIAGLASLSGLVHKIVEDTGAYVRFGRRNPQAIFNIDKLLDTAREFDRRGYTTLQDFVEWVKNIREAEQREATADMNLPGFQGAVSIMTVHKAKGLEYPIVFLPGMNQAPRSVTRGPDVIISERGHETRMAVKDAANPLYKELWAQEMEELKREHQRLLYVAMTRARDHLIMIGVRKDDKKQFKQSTWLDYLHMAVPKPLFDSENKSRPGITTYAYSTGTVLQAKGMTMDTPLTSSPDQSPPTHIDTQTIIDNIAPIPPSRSLEWKRATDFIEHPTALDSVSVETTAGAVSPLTRGSVLHRCLEDYAKFGFYQLEQIITGYFDIVSLDTTNLRRFIADTKSLLGAILSNKELAWIFEREASVYSELPFLYKKGDSLVSGIIDRAIIKGSKGYIIDYKGIFAENEEALKTWTDHYRPQIQIYCEAIKEIFNLASVDGYLLFLGSARLELANEI
ncbi:MAG TPA: UvrD-helicase domain-containing protein [Nitrospirota bacterium]|nr:UvrD-helicase domain-containing protein [Nitrospirota bacterium]